MKDFGTLVAEKGLNTTQKVKDYLVGKRLKVIANNSGHGYLIGDTVRAEGNISVSISSRTVGSLTKPNGWCGNNMYFEDLGVGCDMNVDGIKEELSYLDGEQKKLTEQKKVLKGKLEFLKATGVKSFTDNEYKAYMTLKTFNDNELTDIEKAQAIAKLIDE